MYYQILEMFRTLAENYAGPDTKIEHGTVPKNNGFSVYIGLDPNDSNEFEEQTYFDDGEINNLAIVLKGKNNDLKTLLTTMSNIHIGMSSERPNDENWEIIKIGTINPPNCVELDNDGQWLYSSMFRIKFYYKGSR